MKIAVKYYLVLIVLIGIISVGFAQKTAQKTAQKSTQKPKIIKYHGGRKMAEHKFDSLLKIDTITKIDKDGVIDTILVRYMLGKKDSLIVSDNFARPIIDGLTLDGEAENVVIDTLAEDAILYPEAEQQSDTLGIIPEHRKDSEEAIDSLLQRESAKDSLTSQADDLLPATKIETPPLTQPDQPQIIGPPSPALKYDTIRVDTIRIDTMFLKSLPKFKDEEKSQEKKKRSMFRDTLSSGTVTLMSLVPGLGQAYNRQFWKIPTFYGIMGGFVAGGVITGKKYKNYKTEWKRTVDMKLPQSVQDRAKGKMDKMGTTRTLFYAGAVATYLYQIADATFHYRGPVNHVRKTTILAAVFPGAGFIYTRTYWRLPIYYGGFAAMAVVVDFNNRYYKRYTRAYNALTDGDPSTIDEFGGRQSESALKNARDQYRRNRDLGIIGLVAVYALSIIDAHVIATLKNWDVSPDLSMTVEPTIINNSRHRASSLPSGAGMSLKIRF